MMDSTLVATRLVCGVGLIFVEMVKDDGSEWRQFEDVGNARNAAGESQASRSRQADDT